MNEQEQRHRAKAWIVKNNNLLSHRLTEEGLLNVIEEAFIAGGEDTSDKDRRIERLEAQVEDLYSDIDSLEDKVEELKEATMELNERMDMSVESMK